MLSRRAQKLGVIFVLVFTTIVVSLKLAAEYNKADAADAPANVQAGGTSSTATLPQNPTAGNAHNADERGPLAPASIVNVNLSKLTGYQAETTIAVDPTNPNRMFAAANNIGGPNALFAAYSTDGGATWQYTDPTDKIIGNGGDGLPLAFCDPSAVFDRFGNLYLTYLTASAPFSVVVAYSTNGGQSFAGTKAPGKGGAGSGGVIAEFPLEPGDLGRPSKAVDLDGADPDKHNPETLNAPGDQPTIAAGPSNVAGQAAIWVTWNGTGGINAVGTTATALGTIAAFGSPVLVPTGGSFGDIEVGPNGEVLVAAENPSGGVGPANIFVSIDPDGLGPLRFTQPVYVTSNRNILAPVGIESFGSSILATATNVGGFRPIPAQPNRTVDAEADLAWDRSGGAHNGRVYLAYTDAGTVASSDLNIFVRFSDNNGATWTSPVKINDDVGTNSQFFPKIAVDQTTGNVAVAFYDSRNSAGNTAAQVFGAISTNGGASFSTNKLISQGSSSSSGFANGNEYGDYNGLVYANDKYTYIWADNSNSTGDNPNGAGSSPDIYTAGVSTATPDLSIVKSHSGTFTQGSVGKWTLQVANNSAAAAGATDGSTVTVSDSLPAGWTYQTIATGNQWNCSASLTVVTCTSTSVIAGAGGTFQSIDLYVNVPANAAVSTNNTATVFGGGDTTHTNAGTAATSTDSVTVVQVPATILLTSGNNQAAAVNTTFPTNLAVTVRDAASVAIQGATVTFTAPVSGASGTFSGGTNVKSAATDVSGVATATSYTANTIAGGPYNIGVAAGVVTNNFSETNLGPPAVNLSVSSAAGSETGQTAVTVTATAMSAVLGNQTVSLGVSGAGITAGDYSLSGTTITIPNGQTIGTVTFTVKDDLLNEGTETAALTISGPSAGIALGATLTQNITITDNDNAGTINFGLPAPGSYRVVRNGNTIEIYNSSNVLIASGPIGPDPLVINGTSGNDTLTVDLSGGAFTIPVTFNGGAPTTAPGDKLAISGSSSSQGLVTYNYTNAHDGSVVMGNYGTVNYTGLEPITNTGTASDVVFNLPAGPNTAAFADLGGGMTRLSGATFETTDFVNPSGSVAVNRGNAADDINIGNLAANYPSLTIGSANAPFNHANFNGTITFAAGKNLTAFGIAAIAVPTAASQITMSGAGAIHLTSARQMFIQGGASLSVVGGDLLLDINQQVVPSTGYFYGLDVLGSTIQTTGSGNIIINALGGTDTTAVTGLQSIGMWLHGTSTVIRSTGNAANAGHITINSNSGNVGPTAGSYGTLIQENSLITSVVGAVSLTTKSGDSGGVLNGLNSCGLFLGDTSSISSTGTGPAAAPITINATAGNTGISSAEGIRLGSTIKTVEGAMSVTGTGGNSPGSAGTLNSSGIFLAGGSIISTGVGANAGTLTVVGNAKNTTLGSSQGIRQNGIITSVDGNIDITGTAGSGELGNLGVSVRSNITTTGNANLNITGTGGNGSGALGPNHGVNVRDGAIVSAVNGAITVTGTGGNTADNAGVSLAPATFGTGQLKVTGNGSVTVKADTISIDPTNGSISAGSNPVSLRQKTNGVAINLGSAVDSTPNTLELSNAELGQVTAGTLNIGDANSGTITTAAAITRSAATNMNLTSGGDVVIAGGQINTGGGTLLLHPGVSPFAVKPTNAGVDVTASTLSFGSNLAIAINGTTVDAQYNQLNVTGAVNLTGVSLALSGSLAPAGGQTFVIVNNDGNDAIVGTFNGLPEGATIANFLVPSLSAKITYAGGSGNDVVLTTVATTSTTVTSSANPSVFGQPVTLKATVKTVPAGLGTPTGNVNFTDGGNPILNCQGIGLDVSGQVQCITSGLSFGNHTINAAFLGSTGFLPSTNDLAGNPQVVNQAGTTTSITNSASLTATATQVGTPYAVNWTVAPISPGAGTLTGIVTVTDGIGAGSASCSAPVAAGTCNLTSITGGNRSITATYGGDTNFTGSSSSPAVTHPVNVTISGNIKQSPSNTNLSGVTVTLTGTGAPAPTTTDGSGNYSFTGLFTGATYTVTPAPGANVFDPGSRTFATPATNVSNQDFVAYAGAVPRVLSIPTSYATPTQLVDVLVNATSLGNEKKYTFTMNFDPALLSSPTSSCGTSDTGCTTSQTTGAGTVTVTVTLAAPTSAGNRNIAKVTFQAAANVPDNTTLSLSGTSAADVNNNPMSASFASPALMIFARGVEGDVWNTAFGIPGSGDGTVDALDVLREAQLLVNKNLLNQTNNEFQRADTADPVNKGNGVIDSTDLIQTLLYFNGQNGGPHTTAGGPMQPIPTPTPLAKPETDGRMMSIASTTAAKGGDALVSIELDARGDEIATSFSLRFDPTILTIDPTSGQSNGDVTIGTDAPQGTGMMINADEAGKGRLGIVVFNPSRIPFAKTAEVAATAAAGAGRQVITLRFHVNSEAKAGPTTIAFDASPEAPAALSISNAQAENLNSGYTDGTITIDGQSQTGVTISGRVLTPDGSGLRNARVTLIDATGTARTATTNSFGWYRFDTIEPGTTVTLIVTSKTYRFATRTIQVNEALAEVDFVGLE